MREPTNEEMKMVIRHLQLLDGLRATQVDTLVGSLQSHITILRKKNLHVDVDLSLEALEAVMASQQNTAEIIGTLESSLQEKIRAFT